MRLLVGRPHDRLVAGIPRRVGVVVFEDGRMGRVEVDATHRTRSEHDVVRLAAAEFHQVELRLAPVDSVVTFGITAEAGMGVTAIFHWKRPNGRPCSTCGRGCRPEIRCGNRCRYLPRRVVDENDVAWLRVVQAQNRAARQPFQQVTVHEELTPLADVYRRGELGGGMPMRPSSAEAARRLN